jgi:hypothetical protein
MTSRILNLLICIFALIALTNFAYAQTSRIAGRWSNDDTGEVITITRDPVGGWRYQQSDVGEGRITLANRDGANIYVSARGLSCYYSANVTDQGRRMHWRLVSGSSNCLSRIYTAAE